MPAPEETSPTKSQQEHASARLSSSPAARLREADQQAKLRLRALAAVLSLGSAACFCTALAIWPERAIDHTFRQYYHIGLPTDALPLFPLFWSVISTIVFITCHFKSKRPFHPAFVIANDLAVCVTIGGLAFWIVVGSVFWEYFGAHGTARCGKSTNINTDTDCSPAKTKGLCELAGLSLLAGTLVAHFALFVWSCREVDVRRKRARRVELEALFVRDDGEDERWEMASNGAVDVRGVPRVRTKRGGRIAAGELSW